MRYPFALACLCLIAGSTRAADPPPPETIAELIKKLQDEDAAVRLCAAHQLGNKGLAAREAVPALAKLLHDPLPDVRTRAGKSLAAIGVPAVPVLIDALKENDTKNRIRAAQALAWIEPPAKDAVPAFTTLLK